VPGPGVVAPPPVPANQNWTPGPNVVSDRGNVWPPPLDIPSPTSKPAPPSLLIPKASTAPVPPPEPFKVNPLPGDSRLDGPARVPSCVLVGKQLINFALNDVNGQPWEYKTNRRGKLVLLDFWRTDCIPCRDTIPLLTRLQNLYGNQGLEVIGIAVESGGTAQEQAYKVNRLARQLNVNYRQLLSSSAVCPVRSEFRVEAVPTTVLLDQNGNIIWQHQGTPDRYKADELDRLIRLKLSGR
jgi:thiol-disulfide isomerase/thioredoxin